MDVPVGSTSTSWVALAPLGAPPAGVPIRAGRSRWAQRAQRRGQPPSFLDSFGVNTSACTDLIFNYILTIVYSIEIVL